MSPHIDRLEDQGGVGESRRSGVGIHPGVELRANLKSISHRCYLFEVAFVWDLTKETIDLPVGCLQGGQGMGTDAPPRSRRGASRCDTPHLRAAPLMARILPSPRPRNLLPPSHLCMTAGPVRVCMPYRRVKLHGVYLAAPLARSRRDCRWQDPGSWTVSEGWRGVRGCGSGVQRRVAPGADTRERPATLPHHAQASPPIPGILLIILLQLELDGPASVGLFSALHVFTLLQGS